MNILICEDEMKSLEENKIYISALCKKYNCQANIKAFEKSQIQAEFLQKVQIAFLDIDIERKASGIELANRILASNKLAIIIFITNHKEYAFDAYNIQAFGFILKPVNTRQLERIFAKALFQLNGIGNTRRAVSSIEFTYENQKVLLRQRDIVYVEREDRKVNIVTIRRNYLVNESINKIFKRLNSKSFLQANQSVIVNLYEISHIEKKKIYMKTEEIFKLSRNYSEQVLKAYNEFYHR